jgi:hypothetical protein
MSVGIDWSTAEVHGTDITVDLAANDAAWGLAPR